MKDSDWNQHNAGIASEVSNPLQYINGLHYLKGNATSKFVQETNSTAANDEFVRIVIHEKLFVLKRGNTMMVKTERYRPDEDAFATYGSPYTLVAGPMGQEFKSYASYHKQNCLDQLYY